MKNFSIIQVLPWVRLIIYVNKLQHCEEAGGQKAKADRVIKCRQRRKIKLVKKRNRHPSILCKPIIHNSSVCTFLKVAQCCYSKMFLIIAHFVVLSRLFAPYSLQIFWHIPLVKKCKDYNLYFIIYPRWMMASLKLYHAQN